MCWHAEGQRERSRLLRTLERLLELEATELRGALDAATTLIAEELQADKVDAFLLERGCDTLFAVGTSDTLLSRRQRELGLDRLALSGGGRTVQVFHTGKPRLTGRAEEDPEELRGITEGLGVRSLIESPLVVGGERRGGLSVASTQPDRFSAEDLRFLLVIARCVGVVTHRAEMVERIRERERTEAALRHQAFHDPLTGLPNRALFMDRVEHAMTRSVRYGHPLAVLFLDLDGFKQVNDTWGHRVGDQLLVAVSWRLKLCLRAADTLARLGGDEFTIILEDLRSESDAVRVAERIGEYLEAPVRVEGRELSVSASIGIALSSSTTSGAADLLHHADQAMYAVKAAGKSGFQVAA